MKDSINKQKMTFRESSAFFGGDTNGDGMVFFSLEEKTVVTHRIALCCVLGSHWLGKCVFIPR